MTINLGELVKGLMVVIGIAVSMGKLPELKRWAALRPPFRNSDKL